MNIKNIFLYRCTLFLIGMASCALHGSFHISQVLAQRSDLTSLHKAVLSECSVQEMTKLIAVDSTILNAQTSDGSTALHFAVELGLQEQAIALVEAGANLNAEDQHGVTPFHIACGLRFFGSEALQVLIKAQPFLEKKDDIGFTALHRAIKSRHHDACKALIVAKAHIHVHTRFDHSTPLHCAVAMDDVELVQTLLDANVKSDEKNGNSITSLHIAVIHDNVKVVQALLAKNPNLQNLRTALHYATDKGNDFIRCMLLFKIFVDTAADRVELLPETDELRILHTNARDDLIQTVKKQLMTNINVNEFEKVLRDAGIFRLIEQQAIGNRSLLHAAACIGHVPTVKKLIDQGVDVNKFDFIQRKAALHYAAENGHIKIMQILLDHDKTCLDATIDQGPTPLFDQGPTPLLSAAKNDNIDSVQYLLSKGANVQRSDNSGRSILQNAIQEDRDLPVVMSLIRAMTDINVRDKSGRTALHEAVKVHRPDIAQALIQAGADVNKSSPMTEAIKANNATIVKMLLGAGAKPNKATTGYLGSQELVVAIESGSSMEIIKDLLAAGATPEVLAESLVQAVKLNRIEIVKELVAAGANVQASDSCSRVLDIAHEKEFTEIAKFLRSKGAKQSWAGWLGFNTTSRVVSHMGFND